jgi:hypothetical protein
VQYLSLMHLGADDPAQALVSRQAEQIIDPVCLAPRHQHLAGKTGIGAQQYPYPGPARPNLGDDPGDFLHRPGRSIDVGTAQPGRQQVPAAKDVERQIAVAIVVAVEEPPLLVPVDRVVGGVEIEDDLLARLCAAMKMSTNSRSIAAGSWAILW